MAIRKPSVSVREARRLSGKQELNDTPPSKAPKVADPTPAIATAPMAPTQVEPSKQPLAKKARSKAAKNTKNDSNKVQVYLTATVPDEGVSPSFDLLSRQYLPKKALQMILRRALLEYDVILKEQRFGKTPENYKTSKPESQQVSIQTSRMMPTHLAQVARDHFDPLGFESTRSFGRKLATAALAAFFQRERKRSD